MMTRNAISVALGISPSVVHRHAQNPKFPKPDHTEVIESFGKEFLSPVWAEERLDELRVYFAQNVRRIDPTKHKAHCSCFECCVARSRRSSEYQAKRRGGRIKVNGEWYHPDAPHGTLAGYISYGCLCAPCKREGSINNAKRVRGSKIKEVNSNDEVH